MYHLRVPQTEEELERYYQFRWEMLRKPLHQPKGSERDAANIFKLIHDLPLPVHCAFHQ